MSKRDLQFIERALAHPWMFWIYFWKWPRIVRQACAEYDLLAKERDAAKEAHEQAVRANKIVRDWIHVTHRLDMTADMRAIWTAGKRLSALLLFLALTLSANAQLPPILRNQWTTNANPLALKVISTNGVHAATNVWEVDFTNTATVTVSAVSNANKVMVSFIGSGGGGDTIWTNYGATAYTLIVMPGTIQVFTNGVISSFPTGTNKQAHLTNGGFAGFYSVDSVAVGTPITDSGVAVARFNSDDGLGNTNCDVAANRAGIAAGTMEGSNDGHILGLDGGFSSGFFYWSTNVDIFGDSGGIAGGYMELTTGARIRAVDGSIAGGQIVSSHGGLTSAPQVSLQASDGSLGFGNISTSSNLFIISDDGSIVASEVTSSTNSLVSGNDGSIVAAFVQGANTTNSALIGSIAAGITRSGERLFASGALDGVGALSVGRDIASTNNWTFGIHYTNTVPLSLAVGANGTTQFRAASNSVVIRTETAPAVGQILTATDTSGTVGWSNAPAGSSGIGSIFTNNVLAGGPGLTELEFTNSASVTWVATTNAGRVTMSASSAAGAQTPWASDIDAASFSLANFGSTLSFTNGSKIGATAINTLSLTNAHLLFSADNTFDIGANNATRPRTIYLGANAYLNGFVSFTTSGGNPALYKSPDSVAVLVARNDTITIPLDLYARNGAFTSAGKLGWWSGTSFGSGSQDTYFTRDAAGIIRVQTNLVVVGNLNVGGGITNDTLTASTVLAADATKEIVSIANAAGVLTNDGAGVVGWLGLGSLGGGGDGAGIKVWTNQVAVGVGTNLDLIAGDNITILATNLTGAGGTNAISIGLTTSINTRQVGSAVLTNLAATRAVTNMTVTTITNVGVSLYTVPAGCTYIWVECIGGGGGGGGVDGAASQSAAGGGGGSGAYCSTNIGSPAASYIVTVGTNGLGGAGTGGNAGTIGGTTLFTNILTALGGSGGAGKSSAAAVSITLGGAGALETATGRVYTGGNPGHNGICVSGTLAISGGGAGSHFGGGGAPQTAAVGANATGKGAGGSGAAVITNADRAGGNGSPGVIIIREFYQ